MKLASATLSGFTSLRRELLDPAKLGLLPQSKKLAKDTHEKQQPQHMHARPQSRGSGHSVGELRLCGVTRIGVQFTAQPVASGPRPIDQLAVGDHIDTQPPPEPRARRPPAPSQHRGPRCSRGPDFSGRPQGPEARF